MDKISAIRRISQECDSFYLYEEQMIIDRMNLLKKSFPGVEFLYSMKCNSNANVLKAIINRGFGVDAASFYEADQAAKRNVRKDMIFYSAPGKTREDLKNALESCTIIADSLSEIEKINEIAEETQTFVKIGIRINPDFTFDSEVGISSKFGVDEREALRFLREKKLPFVKIVGIHVHLKSQELVSYRLNNYYNKVLLLATRVENALGERLEFINMGSGIGIPYGKEEYSVNVKWLGEKLDKLLIKFRQNHPDTRILIETGRYITGQCGTYVTKVVDRKQSKGKTYVILAKTLNGFMRPSISRLIAKYTSSLDPSKLQGTEPLFTEVDAHVINTLSSSAEKETVTLVGSLCTAADVIAENITLPVLKEGDIVMVSNAGSYGADLTPQWFSSSEGPREYMLTRDGLLRG